VPREITAGLFWPLVETADAVESHHVQNWLEAWLTSDDGKVGVRPIVKYATGFLPTFGLRFFYDRLPGEGSGVAASFQTAGPSVLMGEVDAAAPRWTGLTFRAIANRRDDRYFAGIGALSKADLAQNGWGPARFGSDIFLGEVRWTRQLPEHFRLSLHTDAQERNYRADNVRGGPSVATVFRSSSAMCQATDAPLVACVDPTLLPGFQNGEHLIHEGIGVAWDYRSQTRDGTGASLAVDATFAEGVGDDPSHHVTLSAEPFVSLGAGDRKLILRGRAIAVETLGDAPIPFEELAMMSGYGGMRGYLDGRFRGQSGLLTTAEYRWYVSHTVDAALFSDVGTVAGHDFEGLGSARWFPSFGVGFRFYGTPGNYWEGDVESGVQFVYAPDSGFRVILAIANF
jgi:outer membrane protein assembly factor BamA